VFDLCVGVPCVCVETIVSGLYVCVICSVRVCCVYCIWACVWAVSVSVLCV